MPRNVESKDPHPKDVALIYPQRGLKWCIRNPTVFWSIGVMGKNQTQRLPDWTFFFAPKQKALRVQAQRFNTPILRAICPDIAN
jgi:hypothetical protein